MHPLAGADPATLERVLALAGPLSPAGEAAMRAVRRSVLLRRPFSAVERAWVGPRLPDLEAGPAPVFILGHWRSGTTNLYQMMVKAGFGFVPPDVTGLPWDMFVLARLTKGAIRRRLPKTRYIDNVPVLPDSPQEDEIALANMTWLSFYHGIYFPRRLPEFVREGVFFDGVSTQDVESWARTFRYFLRKLTLHQGRRLLIKNPVYTARLGMLAAMLPGAKFIHIHRDPLDVFLSMRNFYRKLIAQFALQDAPGIDIDEVILSTYDHMMQALKTDAAAMPPGRYAAFRYDAFMADPLGVLRPAWEQLELGDFAAAEPAFRDYLGSQRAFEPNRFRRDPEAAALVTGRLGHWFSRLDYPLPA